MVFLSVSPGDQRREEGAVGGWPGGLQPLCGDSAALLPSPSVHSSLPPLGGPASPFLV